MEKRRVKTISCAIRADETRNSDASRETGGVLLLSSRIFVRDSIDATFGRSIPAPESVAHSVMTYEGYEPHWQNAL